MFLKIKNSAPDAKIRFAQTVGSPKTKKEVASTAKIAKILMKSPCYGSSGCKALTKRNKAKH